MKKITRKLVKPDKIIQRRMDGQGSNPRSYTKSISKSIKEEMDENKGNIPDYTKHLTNLQRRMMQPPKGLIDYDKMDNIGGGN